MTETEGRIKLVDVHEGKFLALAQSDVNPDHWYEVVGYFDTGEITCTCKHSQCRAVKGDLAVWAEKNVLGGCKHIHRVLREIEAQNALLDLEAPSPSLLYRCEDQP